MYTYKKDINKNSKKKKKKPIRIFLHVSLFSFSFILCTLTSFCLRFVFFHLLLIMTTMFFEFPLILRPSDRQKEEEKSVQSGEFTLKEKEKEKTKQMKLTVVQRTIV